MTAHKKALLRRTDDRIHPCRFANAGPFLRFILPKAADEGRRTAFFVSAKGGLRPTLTVACCPAERADKTADFLKRLGRLFSDFGALFKIEMEGKPF